jgi:hypothetical protein
MDKREETIATPAGMEWCPEHQRWEYPEQDHAEVPEAAPEFQAHLKSLTAHLPGNGGNAKCCDCGRPADIVTDGLITDFYCRDDWWKG